jgi:zinc protease
VRADLANSPVSILLTPAATDTFRIVAQVRAGSAFDPAGREGVAALTAHQVAQSVTQCRDVSVTVGLEVITFTTDASTAAAAACSTSLGQALVTPTPLTKDDRDAHAAELMQASPNVIPDLSAQLVRERVYRAHPYGHASAGRASVALTVTDLELTAFHTRHYVRSTTVITLSGSEDLAAAQSAIAEPLLGLPTTLPADAPRQSPLAQTERSILVASSKTLPPTAAAGQALALAPDHADWSVFVDAVAAFNEAQVPVPGGTWSIVTGPEVAWNTRQPMLLLSVRPTSHATSSAVLLSATEALEAWSQHGVTAEQLLAVHAQADTNPDRVRDLLQRVVAPDTLVFTVVTDRNDRFERAAIEENDDSTVYTRLGISEGHHHTVQAQGLYR